MPTRNVATAEVLWPDTEITKAPRHSAKPFNLGLGYRMGPATLAVKTGGTLAEARRLRHKLQSR